MAPYPDAPPPMRERLPLPQIPRIGLGAMPLSVAGRPERDAAIEVVHTALDAGVRLVDTADAYCLDEADTGHNEVLVAEALACWDGPRDEVVVGTKGGHVRDARGGWHTDGRPEHLAAAAHASRERLGVDVIALYWFHRPDPAVPFEVSVEAVARLLDDGVVARVGLSNVSFAQLESAASIVPVAAVQNEWSPYERGSADVLAWCERHEVPFVAWAPLGGAGRVRSLGEDATTAPFARVAESRGVPVTRVVLAWVLATSPWAWTIPGARRTASILDSIAAMDLALTHEELALLAGAASTSA